MICPSCQRACEVEELQYHSYTQFRNKCYYLDCPMFLVMGFHFIFDYKHFNEDNRIEVQSLIFSYFHEKQWYMIIDIIDFANVANHIGAADSYALYSFHESESLDMNGTFKLINKTPADLLPINPASLAHDLTQHFHRIMNLKAFL